MTIVNADRLLAKTLLNSHTLHDIQALSQQRAYIETQLESLLSYSSTIRALNSYHHRNVRYLRGRWRYNRYT